MAASISAYSGGESLVEMNLPRFSLFGSVGRPTFCVSLTKSVAVSIKLFKNFVYFFDLSCFW